MAVDAVVAQIELAAGEPLCRAHLAVEHGGEGGEPVEFLSGAAPELVGVIDAFAIETLVVGA